MKKSILKVPKLFFAKYKKQLNIILLCLIIIFLLIGIISKRVLKPNNYVRSNDLDYTQEYVIGTSNIKGNVNITEFENISPDFAIGANKDGYAVFKDPDRAFKRLKQNYKKGLWAIQRNYFLLPLSKNNFDAYGRYGWQLTKCTYVERKEALFIARFIDIYENSYIVK